MPGLYVYIGEVEIVALVQGIDSERAGRQVQTRSRISFSDPGYDDLMMRQG